MPEAKLLLMCAAALAALVAGLALWRARRGGGPMVVQTRVLPPMKGSLDAAPGRRVSVSLGRELVQLLEEGRREETIALVRERTGWGAEEAAAAVERMENLKRRLES